MPKSLEQKLRKEAKKKFPKNTKEAKKKRDAYVYGALRKAGWKPSKKR